LTLDLQSGRRLFAVSFSFLDLLLDPKDLDYFTEQNEKRNKGNILTEKTKRKGEKDTKLNETRTKRKRNKLSKQNLTELNE